MAGSEADSRVETEEVVALSLGDTGPWQGLVLAMCSVLTMTLIWGLLAIVFIAAPVPFSCAASEMAASEMAASNITASDAAASDIATSAPCPANCTRWRYDLDVFRETIVTKWDLVCGRHQLVSLTQTSFLFGVMIGTILVSALSDRYGRKAPLVACGLARCLTGASAALAPWFSLFLALRFLEALTVGGSIAVCQVLIVEVLSAKSRSRLLSLTHLSVYLGTSAAALVAYLTRHWRYYQLAITLPSILTLSFIWVLPESPRWLLAVGRRDEALRVLQNAARMNRNPLPSSLPLRHDHKKAVGEGEGGGAKKEGGFVALLATPNMRLKNLVMWVNFLSVGCCFYGIEQYLSHIGGNLFINVALSGICACPGVLLSTVFMSKLGRKYSQIIGQLTISSASFAILLFPGDESEWYRVGLAVLGVVGTGVTFPTVYLFASELLPTVVRGTGVGVASVCARVGAMAAPFAIALGEGGRGYVPPLLFGSVSLAAALLTLLLPETLNTRLPTTLQDGEAIARKKKKGEYALALPNRNDDL